MSFDGSFDAGLAYRLHRLALDTPDDPRAALGYGRNDRALRRGHDDDEAWFERRLEMGERDTLDRASRALAESLAALDWPLPQTYARATVHVQRATALRLAWVGPSARTVALGGRSPATLAIVALYGAAFRSQLAGLPLEAADQMMLELHLGATQIVHLKDPAIDIDILLQTAGRELLPMRGQEEDAQGFLRRVAAACLDQPHGEVERIASGFHSGRTDRLHRAWERGFFVPRGLAVIAPDP